MRPILEKIDALEMGGHRRDLAVAEEYAKRMLALTENPEAKRIVRKLVWEYPSHDFYIDRSEAMDIGLPVSALSEVDGIELAEILLEMDNGDSYEGFVPPANATAPGAAPDATTASVPPSTEASDSALDGGRVNGSETVRGQERV